MYKQIVKPKEKNTMYSVGQKKSTQKKESDEKRDLIHDSSNAVRQAQWRMHSAMQMNEDVSGNNRAMATGVNGKLYRPQRMADDPRKEKIISSNMAVQLQKFTFQEKDYDTDEPIEIRKLVDDFWEKNDEEGFQDLIIALKPVDEDLAKEFEAYWYEGGEYEGEEYEGEEDNYYNEYEEYEEKVGIGKKELRKQDKQVVGEFKRVGSKSQRDKWYGDFANNPEAQEWWHRIGKKQTGNKDMTDAKTAKLYFAEYLKYLDSKKK